MGSRGGGYGRNKRQISEFRIWQNARSTAGKENTWQRFEGGQRNIPDGLSNALLERRQRCDGTLVHFVLDVAPEEEIRVVLILEGKMREESGEERKRWMG